MDYYTNKVLYSLGKIDYAISRRDGSKNLKALSQIYSILITYDGKIKMDTLMKLTGLSREIIVPKLKMLKEFGILNWDGTYLSQEKEIQNCGTVNFKEWYEDLMRKLKNKNLKVEDVKEPLQPEIKIESKSTEYVDIELEDGITMHIRKDKLKEKLLR